MSSYIYAKDPPHLQPTILFVYSLISDPAMNKMHTCITKHIVHISITYPLHLLQTTMISIPSDRAQGRVFATIRRYRRCSRIVRSHMAHGWIMWKQVIIGWFICLTQLINLYRTSSDRRKQ
jgi:hypothetical protein